MTTPDDVAAIDTADIERRGIENLIERLRRQFPNVSLKDIVLATEGQFELYDGCRVRDFIPVLVERSVREQLSARSQRLQPGVVQRLGVLPERIAQVDG